MLGPSATGVHTGSGAPDEPSKTMSPVVALLKLLLVTMASTVRPVGSDPEKSAGGTRRTCPDSTAASLATHLPFTGL